MKKRIRWVLIAFTGICVVMYQYHMSTGVGFNFLDESNSSNNLDDTIRSMNNNGSSKITERTIRLAVERVQMRNGLSPEISNNLVSELVKELRKDIVPGSFPLPITTTSHPPPAPPPPSTSFPETGDSLEPLYIITPTYRRPEQIPELTRMSHTLMLVKNVFWLVIEDEVNRTEQVTELLRRTGLRFEHLVAPMPKKFRTAKESKPRGVSNRNRGLLWLRANATKGIFYFADDDNTYDIALFDEIRKTKTVSMFPVGLCTGFGMSSPIIKNGKFIGFYDGWKAGRTFPVDMAGFAVNVKFLLSRPNALMPFKVGYEEDGFLKSLKPLEPQQIEYLADNCTKILVWHTQTKKNSPSAPLNVLLYGSTNLYQLKKQIV